MSLLKTTGKALLLIILSGLSQNTRKDFSDLLCLCPGKMRTTRAFSGPLRRNSSGTTIWLSSGLLELAVFWKEVESNVTMCGDTSLGTRHQSCLQAWYG